MEPFDIDDVSFFPCTCGYQVRLLTAVFTWFLEKDVLLVIAKQKYKPISR